MNPEDVPPGPVLLDTDVYSWLRTRRSRHEEFASLLDGHGLVLSFVTVAEARAQGSPPLRLAMKLRFLRDAVQALDAESVVVAYGRPDKPIRIERDAFLVVTSPVVLPVELES